MKKVIFIVSLITIYIFASCSEDPAKPNNNNNNNTSTRDFQAMLNNVLWKSDSSLVNIELGTNRKQLRILGFNPADSVELIIKCYTLDSFVVGEFAFAKNDTSNYFGIYHHDGINDTSNGGTIKLETVSEGKPSEGIPTKVAGTFNFFILNGTDTTFNFKNGKFNSGNIEK